MTRFNGKGVLQVHCDDERIMVLQLGYVVMIVIELTLEITLPLLNHYV